MTTRTTELFILNTFHYRRRFECKANSSSEQWFICLVHHNKVYWTATNISRLFYYQYFSMRRCRTTTAPTVLNSFYHHHNIHIFKQSWIFTSRELCKVTYEEISRENYELSSLQIAVWNVKKLKFHENLNAWKLSPWFLQNYTHQSVTNRIQTLLIGMFAPEAA